MPHIREEPMKTIKIVLLVLVLLVIAVLVPSPALV